MSDKPDLDLVLTQDLIYELSSRYDGTMLVMIRAGADGKIESGHLTVIVHKLESPADVIENVGLWLRDKKLHPMGDDDL